VRVHNVAGIEWVVYEVASCNATIAGWTQDDIFQISWGIPAAKPLPEIYATSGAGAKQWYQIALYASVSLSRDMNIEGALTQRQACQQVGCVAGTDNTPEQGWKFLLDELNKDIRTAQLLRWSTDISRNIQ
jgi:hypothetical protein